MAAVVLTHFVDGGVFSTSDVEIASGEAHNFIIPFTVPFPSAPRVMVSRYMTASAPSWVGDMHIGIVGATASQVTVRVLNNSSATHHLGAIYWLAILPNYRNTGYTPGDDSLESGDS